MIHKFNDHITAHLIIYLHWLTSDLIGNLIDDQKKTRKRNTLREEKTELLKRVNELDSQVAILTEENAEKDLQLSLKNGQITKILHINRQNSDKIKRLKAQIRTSEQGLEGDRVTGTSEQLEWSENEEDLTIVTNEEVDEIDNDEMAR